MVRLFGFYETVEIKDSIEYRNRFDLSVFSVARPIKNEDGSDCDWITEAKINGSIMTVSVAKNPNEGNRVAIITVIADELTPYGVNDKATVRVIQRGSGLVFTVDGNKSDFTINVGKAGGTIAFDVVSKRLESDGVTETNIAYVSSKAGVMITNNGGSGVHEFKYSDNPQITERNSTVTFTQDGTGKEITVTINQKPGDCKILVEPSIKEIASDGGSIIFKVTSNSDWKVDAVSGLTIDSKYTTLNSNSEMVVTIPKNNLKTNRDFTFNFSSHCGKTQVVTIIQYGRNVITVPPFDYLVLEYSWVEQGESTTTIYDGSDLDTSTIITTPEIGELLYNKPIYSPQGTRPGNKEIAGASGLYMKNVYDDTGYGKTGQMCYETVCLYFANMDKDGLFKNMIDSGVDVIDVKSFATFYNSKATILNSRMRCNVKLTAYLGGKMEAVPDSSQMRNVNGGSEVFSLLKKDIPVYATGEFSYKKNEEGLNSSALLSTVKYNIDTKDAVIYLNENIDKITYDITDYTSKNVGQIELTNFYNLVGVNQWFGFASYDVSYDGLRTGFCEIDEQKPYDRVYVNGRTYKPDIISYDFLKPLIGGKGVVTIKLEKDYVYHNQYNMPTTGITKSVNIQVSTDEIDKYKFKLYDKYFNLIKTVNANEPNGALTPHIKIPSYGSQSTTFYVQAIYDGVPYADSFYGLRWYKTNGSITSTQELSHWTKSDYVYKIVADAPLTDKDVYLTDLMINQTQSEDKLKLVGTKPIHANISIEIESNIVFRPAKLVSTPAIGADGYIRPVFKYDPATELSTAVIELEVFYTDGAKEAIDTSLWSLNSAVNVSIEREIVGTKMIATITASTKIGANEDVGWVVVDSKALAKIDTVYIKYSSGV